MIELLAVLALVPMSTSLAAEPVKVLAAGSLRGVVTDLAQEAKESLGIQLEPDFGGSGLLRERIEKGEKADLFLSADVGSPEKLANAGRTAVPAVPFGRNRMCIVSRKSAGVTEKNLVKRLLATDVRLKTSTPVADPAGDYAWSIFDRIENTQAGAGAALKEKARPLMKLTVPTAQGQSMAAALFAGNKIDVSITYCSGAGGLLKEVPGLTSFEIPPQFDPHPVYGAAVLSDRPETLRLALFLLSEKGQAILARNGLVPLAKAGMSE
jgi:molybdate transport system substrate-binding protein